MFKAGTKVRTFKYLFVCSHLRRFPFKSLFHAYNSIKTVDIHVGVYALSVSLYHKVKNVISLSKHYTYSYFDSLF